LVQVALLAGIGAIALPGRAVQLADGTVYFDRPPALLGASTTQAGTNVPFAVHYFSLVLSAEAGEPLQRIEIAQDRSDRLYYRLDETRAFVGERRQRGEAIALRTVTQDPDTGVVNIELAEPVAPGQTMTVGLRVRRNPRWDGVYLFGVKAFPAGDRAYGQFLGYGRIHFYNSRDSIFP
jgi:hypothetical protein